ncbi:hypothetical protein D9619_012368 [Psilocybe cf. subviscida]|uniref:Nucleosome assembly protein n=1 Tax=Psilocybe cf. subviscida TaxID=2480587 RepID=A0A8H5AR79_9AGAR|nr:hypothetical protein D9619_012368 [Psilocybe cf. subviscida]
MIMQSSGPVENDHTTTTGHPGSRNGRSEYSDSETPLEPSVRSRSASQSLQLFLVFTLFSSTTMSSNVPIGGPTGTVAPTPQNTPLTQAPIALGLSRPTVPDISEDNEGEAAGGDGSGDGPSLAGLEQHMLGMVQGKLADLIGKSSGYIESLPDDIKANVEALKGVQVKQTELQNQYKRECLELEKKPFFVLGSSTSVILPLALQIGYVHEALSAGLRYLELQKPLYQRRHDIINGKATATAEEIEAGEQVDSKEDDEYIHLPKGITPAAAGIPEFWLTTLRNHVALNELITDRDVVALKHLVDLRLEYLQEAPNSSSKPGFKLVFVFSPNDFFENETLEKTYLYQEEVGYGGDFVYDRAIGTTIKWKEDKDLTKEFEIKKQRNKIWVDTQRTRLVRKARPTDSFFNFFNPPVPPTEEAIENGDIEDEELEELEEKLEEDYQIGEDLKEKVIPRAVDYFTGKALEYEAFDEEDDYDDEDEEDFDDDEEVEDESDSDNDVPVRRRGGGKSRGGAAAGRKQVNPEECKNQ